MDIQDIKNRFGIIGNSPLLNRAIDIARQVAPTDISVLITGESGSGKEVFSHIIHQMSARKHGPFIAVNCGAIPEGTIDSELFGHEKGSFTGAHEARKGYFEVVNGGTIFLDEIAELPIGTQARLLRVLESGEYLRVGSSKVQKTDVRIIAATNVNVFDAVQNGKFREDLYYRINVINVALPSLRERPEDIPVLMDFFIQKRCEEAGQPLKTFSKKCLEKMLDHTWPGNVRELQNEVERLVVLAGDDKNITPDMLSTRILESSEGHSGGSHSAAGGSFLKGVNTNGSLKEALEELEILMIREGLKRCGFNKSKLAKELGISRAGLIMKVDKYGLDKRAIKRAVGE